MRCKCVCPKEIGTNKTNVNIKTVEADQCKCEHIVQREEKFCLRCQCSYEARNTLLIKVNIFCLFYQIFKAGYLDHVIFDKATSICW